MHYDLLFLIIKYLIIVFGDYIWLKYRLENNRRKKEKNFWSLRISNQLVGVEGSEDEIS